MSRRVQCHACARIQSNGLHDHLDALLRYAPAQIESLLQRALGRFELASVEGGHLRKEVRGEERRRKRRQIK